MQRCLLFVFFLLALTLRAEKGDEHFLFDPADEAVPTTVLENPLYYDAGLAPATNGLWIAWLEYVPGQGDQLWLGLRQNEKWSLKKQISEKPGDYANPTVTMDAQDRLWLSYETAFKTNWNVVIQQANPNFTAINSTTFAGINHRVAAAPDGSLAIVYQESVEGRFRLHGTRVLHDEKNKKWSSSALANFPASGNAWRPSVTVAPNNSVQFICDVYDGQSYNVVAQTHAEQTPSHFTLASTPAFEARAQIASGPNEKLYVSWEEDGENWGKHYLARDPASQKSESNAEKKSTRMADHKGPLHRFRKLHFAEFDEKNGQLKEYEFPQPSFELAANRTNRPPGLENFGAFYENSQLVVDGQNRPWIVYRHFYAPYIGLVPETHKQDNMRIYARCLLPDGWSKLYTFSEGQGDGMQRIHVAPTANGIAVAYTFGRADRRKKQLAQTSGVALAEIKLGNIKANIPAKYSARSLDKNVKPSSAPLHRTRPSTVVAGKKYELFFGDMHRHTDISLCFSPADGAIEDAYRYAIDPGQLDFLGITDHTHDLDMGNGLSLIWHRSRKEVNRHALAGRFIPLFSYERSRGDTDHNVFSLHDKILKPHTYPLSQFWEEIDTNTFTVPHQPFNSVTWNYKDDAHRPLMEIYQGFRHDAKEDEASQGLRRGHQIGFIAASDHLSTGGSFSCVWAEKPDRESLFRALQARRTYAATAKIQLQVTCGDHWMGERFAVKEMPPIEIFVKPTAEIKEVAVFVDGEVQPNPLGKNIKGSYVFQPDSTLSGPHIFHFRITQVDGNRAWSSPLWVDIQK